MTEEEAAERRRISLMHRTFCPEGECPLCDERRALRWAYVEEDHR